MSDPTSQPQPPAPLPPAVPPALPPGRPPGLSRTVRHGTALAAVVAALMLIELAIPTHAPFAELSFFLFHGLLAGATCIVLLVGSLVTDRLLASRRDAP